MIDRQQHASDPADFRDFATDTRGVRETARANGELIEARNSLERERRKYYELFELAPDAYVVTDTRGNIREANAAASHLLAVAPQFLIGKPLLGFLDETARKSYALQLDRLCDSERVDDWETNINPRGGGAIPVSVSIGRVLGPDRKLAGYRWIVRDITTRKRAESAVRELNRELEIRVASRTTQLAAANRIKDELLLSERKAREDAEAANRMKSDFLALLSHEFRTPLQAVFGYTELLDREIHGPLNDTQRRYLQRIQQSQQHLLGVINTVLDFAKLESGQPIEIEIAPTPIDEVLDTVESIIGAQLETREIKYVCIRPESPVVAQADSTKVQQIMLNLLSNAIKFTNRGGCVTVECTREPASAILRVRDTGVGIPPDKLEMIFEPFIQIRPKDGLKVGTGLGLSISRRLARAMGGALTVTSEQGKGATFTLRLPLVA
ncbi:MAG TPA: ATP-binding protein [Gemmatimonadaceae bacterium]|jgi:PAS domain S-box-containing protein|nr:ATP-binding protein [Gemmatimonadaceae bacterium]